MSSQINESGKNLMLNALKDACGYLALYTDAAGTIEVSGGSPAYARKPVTYNAASGGQLNTAADVVFDVPAGVTVRAIGMCTALTGGTQHVIDEPPAVEAFGAQGEYKVPAGTGCAVTLP